MLNKSCAETINCSKQFGKGKHLVNALFNVSFIAESGSVTGLLGLNGAGKSTLLKILTGIIYPTNGIVSLAGCTDSLFIRRNTGYVPETSYLDKTLTVKEILYNTAYLHGLTTFEAKDYVSKAVEMCSLEDVYTKKSGTLSKGYMQRTSIANAISFNPLMIVMDEISSGLDPSQIIQIHNLIKNLSKDKIVILSTHHIEEAESLCNKIDIISCGQIVAEGTVSQVINQNGYKNLEETFLALTKTQKEIK